MHYSMDLRKRVVAAVKEGMNKTEASRTFSICRQTVKSWVKRHAAGKLEPITGFQKGHSHGIKDLEAFEAFVRTNPTYTQEEIASHFGVGSSTVSRTLQRIGFTRKKSPRNMQKQMKQNGLII